ncbi:MAG TPA: glycosyltransferase, partial [Candidatus Paceibacterota bacterium]
GGIPDFLIDGSNGFLSKPEDFDDLARVLQKALVMNDDERHAMIQRARAVVCEQYLWGAVAEQMKEVFNTL